MDFYFYKILTICFLLGVTTTSCSRHKPVRKNAEILTVHSDFRANFGGLWERAADYTVQLAELMPAEDFGYAPIGGIFTFREQFLHITNNLYWLTDTYILENKNPIQVDVDANLPKKEVIQQLKNALSYVKEAIKTIKQSELDKNIMIFESIPAKKQDVFYLMRDHITHHRGQCIIYLRMKNIEPPRYIGW